MMNDKNKKDLLRVTIYSYDHEGNYKIENVQVEHKSIYELFPEMYSNIGIGMLSSAYIMVNNHQDKGYEYSKIDKFLRIYISNYIEKNNLKKEDVNLEFINYGRTELVYVLTEKTGKRVTLLVKQPAVEYGKVKQESDYLIELNKKDSNVIAPIDYFSYCDQELYVTPYINQARCIASYDSWGMYVPEPEYRFEEFTPEQEKIVNTCMIAKLVSLYDFEKEEGICKCKLGGGDFMLPKGWEKEIPTLENTLTNLYLIAAREKINCSFEEYLSIIEKEFTRKTIMEKEEDLIMNVRGRVPMKLVDIKAGIALGKKIIEKNITYIDKEIKEQSPILKK